MSVDPELVQELFLRLIELPAADQPAALDRECAADEELRRRVAELLQAHGEPDSYLDQPPGNPLDGNLAPVPNADGAGVDLTATGERTLGQEGAHDRGAPGTETADYRRDAVAGVVIANRYTLQEKIGEGGMGEVWVAKQTEPVKRKVALKLIKTGMDSRAVLQRFEQERQALAVMDHPHIARVLDGGLTPTGQPFFVMELVKGLPLTTFCDESRSTPNERLELFVPICRAVQHAHQKGIVHRDLKPANILVTLIDGRPVPKVIDFGVAKATSGKLTEETLSTGFGSVVGTLEYMSPEQAGFSSDDIDTRADIYSLGVILYELLTGLRPIDSKRLKQAALTEMVRIIREEEPSRPSTRLSTDGSAPSLAAMRDTEPRKLMALLRGDLDWVVMKCLEKQRDRRYETANALARDVQRYLNGDAVEAYPPSLSYRLAKFVKRNKVQVIAASLVLLALVGGVVGTTWGLVNANWARHAEAQQRARAEARETQAIEAVKRFGDAVANESTLKNSPQLEGLRQRLLKEPLGFFDALQQQLQNDKDTTPQSQWRLADASYELGNLTKEIGDWEDALIAYRRSLEIYQALAAADPTDTKLQLTLASSHNEIAVLLRQQGGKEDEGLQEARSALAIRQRLATAHPTDDDIRAAVANSHYVIGALLKDKGNLHEALDACNLALAIQQELADAHPEDNVIQVEFARTHQNIGVLAYRTGKMTDALQHQESARAIFRKLADAHPTVTSYREELGGVLKDIANLLLTTGQLSEASKTMQSALSIQQKLTDDAPSVTDNQRRLAGYQLNQGALLIETRQWPDALAVFEAASKSYEKLVEKNPTSLEFRHGLAESYDRIGVTLREMGQPDEALKAGELGLSIVEGMARDYPNSAKFASAVGGNLNNLANTDLQANRFKEACDRLRQAIEWQRKALAANPKDPQYLEFIVKHFILLIEAANRLGDSEGTTEAVAGLRSALEAGPENAGAYNHIAWYLATAPDKQGLYPHAQQAMTWARQACALAPDDPGLLNTLGVALYRAEQWQEAVVALGKSIEMGADVPHNWLFIAMSHWRLADQEEARRWHEKALAWREINQPDPELAGFFAEAAQLLDRAAKDEPQPAEPQSAEPKKESLPNANSPKAQAVRLSLLLPGSATVRRRPPTWLLAARSRTVRTPLFLLVACRCECLERETSAYVLCKESATHDVPILAQLLQQAPSASRPEKPAPRIPPL